MGKLVDSLRESVFFRRVLGFLWHLTGIVLCYYLAFLVLDIQFNFALEAKILKQFNKTLPLALLSYIGCIFLFRLYQGLWRFFTFRDCLTTAVAFAAGTLFLIVSIYFINEKSFEGYPRSVFIINYLLILGWEVGGRGMVRLVREWRLDNRKGKVKNSDRMVVVGAPEEADSLIRSLIRQSTDLGTIGAIVSDGKRHDGGKLHGIPLVGDIRRVAEIVERENATTILFLPPFVSPQQIKGVIDAVAAAKISCDYRVIPSIDDITAGRVDVTSIRKVDIEDLLHREPYEIDTGRMTETIRGRKVLVTGAGGSIGSEICRQVLNLQPEILVLFEISELHLFEIERELTKTAKTLGVKLIACAGDVRRDSHLRRAIQEAGKVDIIYHAAAYKHVDLMERNSAACFQNNVIGTHTAATVAESEGVKQFVLISSDKAVRPTSLMGASKRLAERAIIERPESNTQFKAVRFGNVLGSSGSVVPIFREQISRGGPVTVTSPKVTRFFMTIPEAVELVLAAGAVGDDRRILVLEMGEPVKIDSLARRMIELSGFVPDRDIKIVFTGLKSGEKEYEELLTKDENVIRTDHDRIWVVAQGDDSLADSIDLGELLDLIDASSADDLRNFAHDLIPGSLLLENGS